MPVTGASVLKAYEQHGVQWTDETETQKVGYCPWCHTDYKFYASKTEPLWDCKRCGVSGNLEQFLERQAKEYAKLLTGEVLEALCDSRGLSAFTLRAWGVGYSPMGFYSIPIRVGGAGKVVNIKRYTLGKRSLSTSGCKLGVIAPLKPSENQSVWVCEGEWDAMALWELLRRCKVSEAVIALPGASVIPNSVQSILATRSVKIAYDHDTAGEVGAVKLGERLRTVAASVRYLHWPNELKEGYDVRDLCNECSENPHEAFDLLCSRLKDYPIDNVANAANVVKPTDNSGGKVNGKSDSVYTGEGLAAHETAASFQKWLHMQNTDVLDIMFGTVFANRLPGDPLWMFLVAPPGGMKSELLMTLSGSEGIVTTTSLTPHALVSGANFGGNDPSLIPKLHEKVLIIKDFTTILTMHSMARDEIFGILRDAYDGRTQKFFGNGVVRDYESSFGILAGVTPAIEAYNTTVLGERFLRYRISGSGRIGSGRRAILQALDNLPSNETMRSELKEVSARVVNYDALKRDFPKMKESIRERIAGLAQWVALLRGVVDRDRYSRTLNAKPMSEIGTRIAKQLLKLAYGICCYRRIEEVDEDVYMVLVKVAQSTAPDRIEEVVRQMFIHSHYSSSNRELKDAAFSVADIADWTKFPTDTVRVLLQDLLLLRVVSRGSVRGTFKVQSSVLHAMRSLRLYERENLWETRNCNKLETINHAQNKLRSDKIPS